MLPSLHLLQHGPGRQGENAKGEATVTELLNHMHPNQGHSKVPRGLVKQSQQLHFRRSGHPVPGLWMLLSTPLELPPHSESGRDHPECCQSTSGKLHSHLSALDTLDKFLKSQANLLSPERSLSGESTKVAQVPKYGASIILNYKHHYFLTPREIASPAWYIPLCSIHRPCNPSFFPLLCI